MRPKTDDAAMPVMANMPSTLISPATGPTPSIPAMVAVQPQYLSRVYQPAQALPLGTLFPELHKPMGDESLPVRANPTPQQQYAFAAWELRLYLNTHPADAQALALFQQMAAQAGNPNYASTFLPSQGYQNTWAWLDDPWPWEPNANNA